MFMIVCKLVVYVVTYICIYVCTSVDFYIDLLVTEMVCVRFIEFKLGFTYMCVFLHVYVL